MKKLQSKTSLWLGAALALATVGYAVDASADQAVAQQKAPQKKADKDKKADTEAPTTTKAITVQPSELAWGIDMKRLGAIYDKIIEEDYKPRYRKVLPGPETERIDAEVAERKSEFRRSLTKFDTTATGYDSSPLKGEFSYRNKEALMSIERSGKLRYFFFIDDKLWKIIDVIKIGEKSAWGKTFDDVVGIMNKYYGAAGRSREPNADEGRFLKEVDWKDAKAQARAIDWGSDKSAMAFQDSATVAQLPTLRKNKQVDPSQVDPSIKDAGRKDPEEKKPADKKPKK